MAPDAVSEQLEELAAEWDLDAPQAERLARFLERLQADPHAPSAVRDRAEAIEVHVADSLAALAVEPLRRARNVADLGSGAGVPGLVIAVALPTAHLRCLESQARKCAFIEDTARHMGLENVEVVCARAELWSTGAGASDAVLARAVAAQPVVLEYAAPLLAPGGVLIDWRGRRSAEEEAAAGRAAAELGLRRTEVLATAQRRRAHAHHVHVFEKVAPTPQRFPRRPGVARKRPLGG
jgi:16S rRNA (guanine527-N7)-methyltransferase